MTVVLIVIAVLLLVLAAKFAGDVLIKILRWLAFIAIVGTAGYLEFLFLMWLWTRMSQRGDEVIFYIYAGFIVLMNIYFVYDFMRDIWWAWRAHRDNAGVESVRRILGFDKLQ
jgi:hypothetical protein